MSNSFYKDILKLDDLNDPYQRNYFYGHFNQLNKVFVATKKLLGEDNFNYFAQLYVKGLKSTQANMDLYGDEFPEFLSKRAELEEMPFLRGIASIDYYWFLMPETSLEVEKGMLDFWGKVINDESLENIELDADEIEIISIHSSNDEYFLVTNLRSN